MTTDLSFTARSALNHHGGGVLAMIYPVLLLNLSLTAEVRGSSRDYSDLATATLGAIVRLIGAPTTWVFAFDFIAASPLTVLAVGALSSLPLWYLLGSRLAHGTEHWRIWITRYASICGMWTMLTFVLIVVLDGVV